MLNNQIFKRYAISRNACICCLGGDLLDFAECRSVSFFVSLCAHHM